MWEPDRTTRMLESILTFFSELTEGSKSPERFEPNDYRLAAAALLVHASAVDGTISAKERETLEQLLKDRFDLDDAAAAELVEKGTAADRDAIDLYRFTSVINRSCNLQDRLRIIEMMWEIVLTDGRVTEFEDNLLWRVGDLLGVDSHDRIGLRQSVSERVKTENA
jgi:uncharacterized tellurite resistance protein B-like protein